MEQFLFRLKLKNRRDLVLLRQRVRQIGRLLGLGPLDQASLAASIFAAVTRNLANRFPGILTFLIQGQFLVVRLKKVPGKSLAVPFRLQVLIPEKVPYSVEDLAWMIQELDRRTPADFFREFQKQNEELLLALGELRTHLAGPAPAILEPVNHPAA